MGHSASLPGALADIRQQNPPSPYEISKCSCCLVPYWILWAGGAALGDAAGCWEEPPVPPASFLACLWARCPPQHQLQLLKLLPCDHAQGPLLGRNAGRDAGSRLQTRRTERSKMHPGTRMAEPPGSREERALEGMRGHRSQECSSSYHSIPECCICSERLPENLLIWQPCTGERPSPSHSSLHPRPVPSTPLHGPWGTHLGHKTPG